MLFYVQGIENKYFLEYKVNVQGTNLL